MCTPMQRAMGGCDYYWSRPETYQGMFAPQLSSSLQQIDDGFQCLALPMPQTASSSNQTGTQTNEARRNGEPYDIALGWTNLISYSEHSRDGWRRILGPEYRSITAPILRPFVSRLNEHQAVQNEVFGWYQWQQEPRIPVIHLSGTIQDFELAASQAEHLHVNTQGISEKFGNLRVYAYDYGFPSYRSDTHREYHITAHELLIIYNNQEQYCNRITFYKNGDPNQVDDTAKSQICTNNN